MTLEKKYIEEGQLDDALGVTDPGTEEYKTIAENRKTVVTTNIEQEKLELDKRKQDFEESKHDDEMRLERLKASYADEANKRDNRTKFWDTVFKFAGTVITFIGGFVVYTKMSEGEKSGESLAPDREFKLFGNAKSIFRDR